jgi:NAD(P)H-flavin reductase
VISRVDDLDSVVPARQQLGRDHRRFGVVRDHYPAVGEALLATLEHFSGDAWTPELARDWATAYGIVADVMGRAADDAATTQPPWWDLTVTRVERRSPGVAVLTVVPHAPLPYRAGQSLAIEAPMRPRLWRYYTPATLPGPDGFELHVRLVPGGPVSTALVQAVQPGDVLRAGSPVGTHLTLAPAACGDLVLLAGGTGLAPMKALLQQLAATGDARRAHLFWGASHHHELYDLPAVRGLAARDDRVRFVPCVSEEGAGPGVQAGTVVDVALRHGPWTDHDVYVCGSPEMVRASVDALARDGVPANRLHVEEFGSKETAT